MPLLQVLLKLYYCHLALHPWTVQPSTRNRIRNYSGLTQGLKLVSETRNCPSIVYILVQISNSLISITFIINWITPLMHCVVAWNNIQYMMITTTFAFPIWQIPKRHFLKYVFESHSPVIAKTEKMSDIFNNIWAPHLEYCTFR